MCVDSFVLHKASSNHLLAQYLYSTTQLFKRRKINKQIFFKKIKDDAGGEKPCF